MKRLRHAGWGVITSPDCNINILSIFNAIPQLRHESGTVVFADWSLQTCKFYFVSRTCLSCSRLLCLGMWTVWLWYMHRIAFRLRIKSFWFTTLLGIREINMTASGEHNHQQSSHLLCMLGWLTIWLTMDAQAERSQQRRCSFKPFFCITATGNPISATAVRAKPESIFSIFSKSECTVTDWQIESVFSTSQLENQNGTNLKRTPSRLKTNTQIEYNVTIHNITTELMKNIAKKVQSIWHAQYWMQIPTAPPFLQHL